MSAFPFPHIWIPDRRLIAPRWWDRLASFATVGMGQTNANGRARTNSNGRWITNATTGTSCCCACACTSNCNTGTTIKQFSLSASSIAYTGCEGTCITANTDDVKYDNAPDNPNGSFTITQLAFPLCCTWTYNTTTTVTGHRYNKFSACNPATASLAAATPLWELSRNSVGWELSYLFNFGANTIYFFYGAITTSGSIDCNPSTLSFTNTLSNTCGTLTIDGSTVVQAGTGGSATVTFP